jgi:hypothetical protein
MRSLLSNRSAPSLTKFSAEAAPARPAAATNTAATDRVLTFRF